MNRYAALLRGINVGGYRKIKMDKLRELFRKWGFLNIQTYIQSGNIVFDSPDKSHTPDLLSGYIKDNIEKDLGYQVPVIIRSIKAIGQIIADNPFQETDPDNNKKLYVTFLSGEPSAEHTSRLLEQEYEHEQFRLKGTELYVLIHKEQVKKQLFSNNWVEKQLKVSATNRNWRTVNKLYEMGKEHC